MDSPIAWLAIAVVLFGLGFALAAWFFLSRLVRNSPPVSAEERADLAASPNSPLQKVAWAGVLVGVVQGLAIGGLFVAKGGAAVYWEDDQMRMQVMGIFILGLVLSGLLSGLAQHKADEREHHVLLWAPRIQSSAMLVAMGLGTVFLVERFHDQGTIPIVYLYLALGTLFMVHMTTYFLGILIGYRAARLHG
jgi:MFS family permease